MADHTSTVSLPYFVCKTCGVVDHDTNRLNVDSSCSQCGAEGEIGQLYYPISVQTVVKLIRQMGETRNGMQSDDPGPGIAVVLFYCTLVEVLMDRLLTQIMRSQNLPQGVQERMLDDHPFVSKRAEKLFPSLTSDTWNQVISKISDENTSAYRDVNDLYLQANKARNNFLHEGQAWPMPSELPQDCLRYVIPTLDMFATLHNECVAPAYGKDRPYVDG